jgi:hypothetical protein
MMCRFCDHANLLRRAILRASSPLLVWFLSILGAHLATATSLLPAVPHFQFEQQAQQHCPTDTVVWAIARLGIYNTSIERWYGQTSDGAFICLGDAEKAGYRATRIAR